MANNYLYEKKSPMVMYTDLTRFNKFPPKESTLDGRWTRKPFGLSRVQPIYLNVLLRFMSILFLHINTTTFI